ncbi:unnamed protein product [Strongylus vulgaris]|uniref:Protein UNC80 C-terminal domain-containing protein n=1 Tax=Strongylus vulgaris TaxID=40348 RepID=A0A3P7JH43_STRVU|nr:unnamed protein product [Strongylus vulgaris]
MRGSAIVQQAAYEPALFHHQQEQGEESETAHHPARHPLPVAQPLFPSPLLAVIPSIIEMLDDPQVDKNGISGIPHVTAKKVDTTIQSSAQSSSVLSAQLFGEYRVFYSLI